MFTFNRAGCALGVLFLLSGCAGTEEGDGALGWAGDAVESTNTLTANTLTANTLTANTLTANTLTANTLTANGLSPVVVTALQDVTPVGAANRTVFHYLATCALTPAQSVTYTWSDGTNTYTVTEVGQVGVAPQWATQSLDVNGQQLVSACVAARINYFGVTVPISERGFVESMLETTTQTELAQYPYVEGAFWGNLFAPTPTLASCYNPANVAHSRADQRDCATGYLDANGQLQSCGPIVLTGSCDAQCLFFDSRDQLYVGCGGTWNALSVGLQ